MAMLISRMESAGWVPKLWLHGHHWAFVKSESEVAVECQGIPLTLVLVDHFNTSALLTAGQPFRSLLRYSRAVTL